jgi:hypothetical protein
MFNTLFLKSAASREIIVCRWVIFLYYLPFLKFKKILMFFSCFAQSEINFFMFVDASYCLRLKSKTSKQLQSISKRVITSTSPSFQLKNLQPPDITSTMYKTFEAGHLTGLVLQSDRCT